MQNKNNKNSKNNKKNNKITNISKEVFFINKKSDIILSKQELINNLILFDLADLINSEKAIINSYAKYINFKIKK